MIEQYALLTQLLDTELSSKQQEIVEQYLFDTLVSERLSKQKEYIEGAVSDDIGNLSHKQVVDMLKDRLG